MSAHVPLANGWTLSISVDTPPAFCSVAAWPSHYGDAPRDQDLWFAFDQGRVEYRCHSLEDLWEALELVLRAPPRPPARRSQD